MEIDRKIADLKELREELVCLLDQCARATVVNCIILDALAPAGIKRQNIEALFPHRIGEVE